MAKKKKGEVKPEAPPKDIGIPPEVIVEVTAKPIIKKNVLARWRDRREERRTTGK